MSNSASDNVSNIFIRSMPVVFSLMNSIRFIKITFYMEKILENENLMMSDESSFLYQKSHQIMKGKTVPPLI